MAAAANAKLVQLALADLEFADLVEPSQSTQRTSQSVKPTMLVERTQSTHITYICEPLFCDLQFCVENQYVAVPLSKLTSNSNIVSMLALDTKRPYNNFVRTSHIIYPPARITRAGLVEFLDVKLLGKELCSSKIFQFIIVANYLGMDADEIKDCDEPLFKVVGDNPSKDELMKQLVSIAAAYENGTPVALHHLQKHMKETFGIDFIVDTFSAKVAMNILSHDIEAMKFASKWKDIIGQVLALQANHGFHIDSKSWPYILDESAINKFVVRTSNCRKCSTITPGPVDPIGHLHIWLMLTKHGALDIANGIIHAELLTQPTILCKPNGVSVMVHREYGTWKFASLTEISEL